MYLTGEVFYTANPRSSRFASWPPRLTNKLPSYQEPTHVNSRSEDGGWDAQADGRFTSVRTGGAIWCAAFQRHEAAGVWGTKLTWEA